MNVTDGSCEWKRVRQHFCTIRCLVKRDVKQYACCWKPIFYSVYGEIDPLDCVIINTNRRCIVDDSFTKWTEVAEEQEAPSIIPRTSHSLEQSGLHLLKAFAQHAVDRSENHIHFLCYEHSTRKMKSGLRNISEDYVHFHDCFTDHRGWIERVTVSQIVCLMHEDTLPDAHVTLPQLCHLATSSIRIGPSTQFSRGNPVASITHKKQGGKVLRHVECYAVDTNNRVKTEVLTELMPTNRGVTKDVCSDSDLPQDLTTFKLSLGQQEREARSQLVLPYLRVNSEKGGRVFYQPDAADDFDEEDPDDDLDI
ncbi:hypothetical protein Cfor_03451 [Coptotermes formosanus]|uniref:Elongator complex protein 5 n=1 Tax=Coptotermes formosanus TaxID=36987 RepID=A0A6L2PLV9_COPFO|nr:hypothetical protein Cfor_03451 [Coptotermes formosanus]